MAYMVSSKDCPSNHLIYALDVNLGTSILCYDDDIETTQKENLREIQNPEIQQQVPKMEIIDDMLTEEEKFWNLEFDGAVNKDEVGAGVWIIGPNHFSKTLSVKLYFDCTNNMAEYEAFITGLRFLKDLGEKKVSIHGDSKLSIQQVKGVYQTKNPRMRSYRNVALDLLQNFIKCNFTVIPRLQNAIADALAVSTTTFKMPIHRNRMFEIDVKH
jgi:ribonuclease HI